MLYIRNQFQNKQSICFLLILDRYFDISIGLDQHQLMESRVLLAWAYIQLRSWLPLFVSRQLKMQLPVFFSIDGCMSRLFAPERLLIGPVTQWPAENKTGGRQMNFCHHLWSIWSVRRDQWDQLTHVQWKPSSVRLDTFGFGRKNKTEITFLSPPGVLLVFCCRAFVIIGGCCLGFTVAERLTHFNAQLRH